MNNDLISREALKKALIEAHINKTLTFDIATFGCVMNTIDNAPTVEPTKGKWLPRTSYDGFTYWRCDNCRVDVDETTDYCPHCGADMRRQ